MWILGRMSCISVSTSRQRLKLTAWLLHSSVQSLQPLSEPCLLTLGCQKVLGCGLWRSPSSGFQPIPSHRGYMSCVPYIQIAFSWQCLYPRRQRWTMKSPLKRIAQSMRRWSTIAIWPCFCSPMANEQHIYMGGLYLHGSHHAHRQLQLCQIGPTLLLYIEVIHIYIYHISYIYT